MALIQSGYKRKFEAELTLKYMRAKMRNNQNFLSVITGSTGSGKSYSCLRLGELWYPYFFDNGKEFPPENICFSVGHLIKRLRTGGLKKGDLLIVEEVGISANAKNFQSKTNKALQYILQSFRSLNIIVLFNVPHFSFFDKTARMLMHSHMQTKKIDVENKTCTLKPFLLQTSQSSGKIYSKYMRIRNTKTNLVTKITRLVLNKPSKELCGIYEDMKNRFVKTLIEDLDDQNILEDQQITRKLKSLTPRQQEVFDYLNMGKTTSEIAEIMALQPSIISTQKKYIRNKGYIWKITK